MGISASDLSTELSAVTFRCRMCKSVFNVAPERVDSDPTRPHHPWRYFSTCRKCEAECEQAGWEVALMASYGKHTGPKTPDGIAAVTDNIKGHPTPEEAMRTRFNAMKHGVAARTALFFPSKPGKYDRCKTCDIPHDVCSCNPACVKQTELFMKHRIALEFGDASMLQDLNADFQANLRAITDNMILSILNKGVALETPAWYSDKDGDFHLAEYKDDKGNMIQIMELKAHPLLKLLMEVTAKNSLSLDDLALTPKANEEMDTVKGFLDKASGQGGSALEYQRKTSDQLDKLMTLIKRGGRDPLTIEHG